MISILDICRLVLKYAFEKKSRVILTISGIVIGIFTFTFFIFLSQGLSNAISNQFTTFGVNVIALQAVGSSMSNGPPGGGSLTDTDIERAKKVLRDYKYIAPAIFYSGKVEFSRVKQSLTTLAYPDNLWPEVFIDLGNEIEKGRFLRPGEKGSAVIGGKVSDKFLKNKPIQLGSIIKVNGKSLRVIGILKEKGDLFIDNSIQTNFNDMKEISGQNTYTAIRVSFYEGVDIAEMMANIDRQFNKNGKEKRINISTPSQMLEKVDQILGLLTLIISFIASIALLVGGINVMNTMHSNVFERINEISVMKALGAQNSDIRNLFLIESSLLGLIGALIGFVLAFGLAKIISYIIINFAGYNVEVFFSFSLFFEIIIITTLLTTVFGTYPALTATKINPSDNLRDE